MTKVIKYRMTAFALAIALLALMIGWAAQSSWRHIDYLQVKLTREPLESFRAADRFLANLEDLNSILFRYQVNRQTNEWVRFTNGLKKLDVWIDAQTNLTSLEESNLLQQINTNYDAYLAAARKLELKPAESGSSEVIGMGLQEVEHVSRQLRQLDTRLLVAHRESMDQLLDSSRHSQVLLRMTMFAALFTLLVLGTLLAVMVYREMIAPLQRKLLESRAIIERQEKLASLGVLAAGVAHEIRNPLTSIKARLYTQQKTLRPDSPEQKDALVIAKEINRLENIVKDVLQFARPDDPRFTVVQAAVPLQEARDLLAGALEKNNIKLTLELVVDAQVRIDGHQIQQVLINLIQNAAESIERNGAITLRARAGHERLHGQLTPVVIFEVQDTGKGIPPEVQARLFDPFFSTKDTGTGLGLSIAARIMEKHGGTLGFQTQVNHGTIFTVVLPIAG